MTDLNLYLAECAGPTTWYANIDPKDCYIAIEPRSSLLGLKPEDGGESKEDEDKPMNPLRPRNQSKAAADAEAKRAGGLYYDKSKHNIVIRSHKQPGLKRLCILTPFSVSGFCMLQHGSGTVNPDSKPPPNASFTPKGDGDFKLPLTSKAYDEECIDNFGQDLEFSKFRAWWLKMTKWFVIECLKIGAIANMGQKKKDMIAAKKTQLQKDIKKWEKVANTEEGNIMLLEAQQALKEATVDWEEVADVIMQTPTVKDKFGVTSDDPNGFVLYFEMPVFRDREATDKYIPRYKCKANADGNGNSEARKAMIAGKFTEAEGRERKLLEEDMDIKAKWEQAGRYYMFPKIRKLKMGDQSKEEAEDVPYWMRDKLGGSLMAVLFSLDNIVDYKGSTSIKPVFGEAIYAKGWSAFNKSSNNSSTASSWMPQLDLSKPVAGHKRKEPSSSSSNSNAQPEQEETEETEVEEESPSNSNSNGEPAAKRQKVATYAA